MSTVKFTIYRHYQELEIRVVLDRRASHWIERHIESLVREPVADVVIGADVNDIYGDPYGANEHHPLTLGSMTVGEVRLSSPVKFSDFIWHPVSIELCKVRGIHLWRTNDGHWNVDSITVINDQPYGEKYTRVTSARILGEIAFALQVACARNHFLQLACLILSDPRSEQNAERLAVIAELADYVGHELKLSLRHEYEQFFTVK